MFILKDILFCGVVVSGAQFELNNHKNCNVSNEVCMYTCDTNLLCSHQNSLYNDSDYYNRVNLTVSFDIHSTYLLLFLKLSCHSA